MNRASTDWFAFDELAPGTWLVAEPSHVNCYLVAGTERAVLIDTGLGLGDIRAAAQSLTPLPITVVNTHSHSDHRGGNWRFDAVAAHPLAADTLAAAVSDDYLAAYLNVARELLASYERIAVDDDRFFHLFTDATRPRPLPADADGWTVPGGPAPAVLHDRERIDLGGRALTVVFTPGHSPDSLCLVDETAGLLFAGDTLITGDFWAHTPDTEIAVFAATLRALADEFAGALQAVHPAHSTRYRVSPRFLVQAADAFEAIVAGTSVGRPGTDLLQRPAMRHEYPEFTVLRPVAP